MRREGNSFLGWLKIRFNNSLYILSEDARAPWNSRSLELWSWDSGVYLSYMLCITTPQLHLLHQTLYSKGSLSFLKSSMLTALFRPNRSTISPKQEGHIYTCSRDIVLIEMFWPTGIFEERQSISWTEFQAVYVFKQYMFAHSFWFERWVEMYCPRSLGLV